MISGHLSIRFGLRGPNLGVVTACTTSTHAIGIAMRTIQYGDADIVLAGGSEMATTRHGPRRLRPGQGAVDAQRCARRRPAAPGTRTATASCCSDGGGAMVLEELEHAKRRGARIYAELAGFGMSGDAHHITAPPEDGNGARRAMQTRTEGCGAESRAMCSTSTRMPRPRPLGDMAETLAIKGAFGEHAYKLAVSSTKSVTGHLLGAAGVVEAIFSTLAIRDQVAPPTMNLHDAGRGLRPGLRAAGGAQMRIDAALSNSFGFGGTNGTLAAAPLTPAEAPPWRHERAARSTSNPLRWRPQRAAVAGRALAGPLPGAAGQRGEGPLSHVSMLAALPRASLSWIRGRLHSTGHDGVRRAASCRHWKGTGAKQQRTPRSGHPCCRLQAAGSCTWATNSRWRSSRRCDPAGRRPAVPTRARSPAHCAFRQR